MTTGERVSEPIKHGIVAYFDILGYQSILMNNQVNETAEFVIKILMGMPEHVKSTILTALKEKQVAAVKQFLDKMEWIVFSDTIVVAIPVAESDEPRRRFEAWYTAILTTLVLQAEMFNQGCPVRGAISYGDFYIEQRCFAGRPIIEAYQLAQQLDLAACGFCEPAVRAFDATVNEASIGHVLRQGAVVPYLVPLNNGKEQRLMTVRWGHPLLLSVSQGTRTIRQMVLDAFLAHNKDVPASVRSKIDNTEVYLAHLLLHFSEDYSKTKKTVQQAGEG